MDSLILKRDAISVSERYLISLSSERSRITVKSALNQVATTLGYYDHKQVPWNELETFQVNAALTALQKRRNLAPSTINLYLSSIKGVFKEGWNAGFISFEAHQRIASIKQTKGQRINRKKVYLTPSIVTALISDASQIKSLSGYRNAAILGLLAYAGLRREEVTDLKMRDIDLAAGEMIIKGKGNKERLGFISEELNELLCRWFDTFEVMSEYAFFKLHKHDRFVSDKSKLSGNSIYDIVKHHGENIDMPNLHPHALRSYFGTTLLDNGVDIVTVRDLMGHESFSTTEIYIRRDKNKLKAAISSFNSNL